MFPINSPTLPTHLLDQISTLISQQKRFALLTLIHIEGSAPYPLGSQMLVSESGEYWGQITGGCAETALADQAQLAMQQQQSQSHRYGLGSPFFDIQLPCGSGIDVHFDVSTPDKTYQDLASELQNRQACKLELSTERGMFVRHYLPTGRLNLFGQGPILLSLAELARLSGFEVVAIVQDESDQSVLEDSGFRATLLRSADVQHSSLFDAHAAVISLFHEHEREIEVLQAALESPVFYIGALGSRRTHSQRLEALQQCGVEAQNLARIHGPVGLDIDAENPAQIAVSILAEVVAKMPKLRALHD